MLSMNVVEKARGYRKVSVQELERAIGCTNYRAKINNSKNLTVRSMYEILDALDFYILVIPKEDIKPSTIKHCMRVDLSGEKSGFKSCPHCGHKLTAKETAYAGCPYCFKRYLEFDPVRDDKVEIPYVLHPPKTDESIEYEGVGVLEASGIDERLEKPVKVEKTDKELLDEFLADDEV